MSNVLTVVLPILILLSIPPVFADNPTPYNEWDFDLIDVRVTQDPDKPREMIISVDVFFKGTWDLGSVKIYSEVTNPDGTKNIHSGKLQDIKKGETDSIDLTHTMRQEGTYTVFVWMVTPDEKKFDWQFDEGGGILTIESKGFERSLGIIADDYDTVISYKLVKPSSVKDHEIVHAKINLPEVNMFEKGVITNYEFTQDFDLDTTDLYLQTINNFTDMKVHLVEEGNLLPLVYPQNDSLDFVSFYVVDVGLCPSGGCISIDYVEPHTEEFPYWVLIVPVIAVGSVIYFLKRKKKLDNRSKNKPNTNTETDETGYLTKIKSPY